MLGHGVSFLDDLRKQTLKRSTGLILGTKNGSFLFLRPFFDNIKNYIVTVFHKEIHRWPS